MKGIWLGVVCALLLGASPVFAKKPAKSKTVFQQIGGKPALTKVVDDFVTRCATDDRINSFFKDVASDPRRLNRFKANLVDQLCQATGGPCKYRGRSMKLAHRGMGVQEVHFNTLVENLNASLDKFHVKPELKAKIVAKLAPMKSQIVEDPARSTASHK